MAERDFLVIYEETDPDGLPTNDSLVLDIEAGRPPALGELDVEQNLDLQLTNTTNVAGKVGFVLSCLGALLGAGLMAVFSMSYPAEWYDETGNVANTTLVRNMVVLSILCLLVLVVGTILTHYGRRIQASGSLSGVRIVEKTSQSRVRLD